MRKFNREVEKVEEGKRREEKTTEDRKSSDTEDTEG
jgi:hypothetical protein